MTEPFVEIPIEVDPEQMIEDVYEDLAEAFPGWEPSPANLDTWLVRSFAYRLAMPVAELSADVSGEIFAQYGATIFGIVRFEAIAATGTTTWTVVDDTGYTIEAGTEVGIRSSTGALIGFKVSEDVEIPPGNTATTAGEVPIEAIEPGAEANDLDTDPELVTALGYVTAIELVGSTDGGSDAELIEDYLDRLKENMQTLAPRPILPVDVEILARNHVGVERAVAVDGWDAVAETGGHDRTVTVFPHDEDGAPVSAPLKAEILADLEAKREANFVFYVDDPTDNPIDVDYTVVAYAGFDQATVEANVQSAIEAWLAPTRWGLPPFDSTESTWLNTTTLRYQDLAAVVNAVPGVSHYSLLEVSASGDPTGTADVVLDGPAPLTSAGTIQAL